MSSIGYFCKPSFSCFPVSLFPISSLTSDFFCYCFQVHVVTPIIVVPLLVVLCATKQDSVPDVQKTFILIILHVSVVLSEKMLPQDRRHCFNVCTVKFVPATRIVPHDHALVATVASIPHRGVAPNATTRVRVQSAKQTFIWRGRVVLLALLAMLVMRDLCLAIF